MNCTKQISMTGYLVRHVDLREAKPRSVNEDVYVMEKGALSALSLLGLSVTEFIAARYERGGYHVISVERIPKRRTAEINLLKVWQCAHPDNPDDTAKDINAGN